MVFLLLQASSSPLFLFFATRSGDLLQFRVGDGMFCTTHR